MLAGATQELLTACAVGINSQAFARFNAGRGDARASHGMWGRHSQAFARFKELLKACAAGMPRFLAESVAGATQELFAASDKRK